MRKLAKLFNGRRSAIMLAVTSAALVVTGSALATGPTVPTVDPSGYGDTLLSNIGTQLGAVLPYAAAFTAFAIGVGFIKGWIGRKKATQVAH